MGIKSTIVKPIARLMARRIQEESLLAIEYQQQIFYQLIRKAKQTAFGRDHNFKNISDYQAYKKQVPVRDYEELRIYIDRIVEGEPNVTWLGRPKYFAKTSGTTSGSKYIPITTSSMSNHFGAARNALFCQATRLNDFSFFDGKMIFLSGSPQLSDTHGIPTGRLSGIVNHAIPSWLRKNQLPSYKTNCIEDWDLKIDKIIDETRNQKMTLISGIPPWVKDYFERLLETTAKDNIKQLFPSLKFIVHGGVNFEPYRTAFDKLIGNGYNSVETYPASEGFIAFQDANEEDGLLLNTNSGIFYEFIPVSEFHLQNPMRLSLEEVEVGVNYVIILSSNAGLWAYNIGDTVQFVSTKPWRLRVTGRIKHFISTFGEHVIAHEVEQVMITASDQLDFEVSAFTVAPKIDESNAGNSCHQWIIETGQRFELTKAANLLDDLLRNQNSYYDDLRNGNMLALPEIKLVPIGTFSNFMKSQGKQGGQNKIPILSNDRKLADGILLDK